jgi:hypothetical protein
VLLTGSVSLSRCDAASDVDMSIYYRELPAAEELEALVEAAKATGGGLYSMDQDAGMACYSFIDGVKVDTGHGRTADIAALVEGFAVEPKLDDTNTFIITSGIVQGAGLYGAALIAGWQRRLAELPQSFGRSLVERYMRFAPTAVLREMGAARGDYPFVYELMVDQARNLLYTLCGLNRRIPPGKVKGMELTLERLALAPRDVVARARHMWVLPPIDGVAELYGLIGDTLDLVDAHMPEVSTARVRERLTIPLRL